MSDDWDEDYEDEDDGAWPAPWEPGERPDMGDLFRGVAWGWLSMLPLLIAYEWGVALSGGEWHNTSALAMFAFLRPLGSNAEAVRFALLAVVTLLAAVHCLRREWGLVPLLVRTATEGLIAALVLGPVLVWMISSTGDLLPPLPQLAADSRGSARLVPALLVFGGAAYEELLFRLGAYAALYVIAEILLRALAIPAGVARWGAELFGLLGSSIAFAAFHLEGAVRWLGVGGEVFHPAVFTYRVLAGVLLGLLFRWRGPGTAAWAHGLFNLALLLGASPDVFR